MAVLDSQRINPLVAAILGILIAVAITTSMTMSAKWTAFGMIGIAAALPALLLRPAKMYGLAAYLILLVIEPTGMNISSLAAVWLFKPTPRNGLSRIMSTDFSINGIRREMFSGRVVK